MLGNKFLVSFLFRIHPQPYMAPLYSGERSKTHCSKTHNAATSFFDHLTGFFGVSSSLERSYWRKSAASSGLLNGKMPVTQRMSTFDVCSWDTLLIEENSGENSSHKSGCLGASYICAYLGDTSLMHMLSSRRSHSFPEAQPS